MSFDEPILIDIDGVAARLSLSRRAIQNLIYAGELESVCIGRARRVLLSDLHAFIQEKKAASTPSNVEAVRPVEAKEASTSGASQT